MLLHYKDNDVLSFWEAKQYLDDGEIIICLGTKNRYKKSKIPYKYYRWRYITNNKWEEVNSIGIREINDKWIVQKEDKVLKNPWD